VAGFTTLGAVSARMHAHARAWKRPPGFDRPVWDYEHCLGPRGHWGPWQAGLGMGPEERAQLDRLDRTIARRLDAYGQSPARFGLVHADIRLANLLVDGSEVRVIDFDDCGFSWFMYDFATTVSFMEDHPRVPELREAWLNGYRSVAPLAAEDEAELETFVMLRRLLLVAWIGSHHTFATEAAELGAGFTAGTCALAERYLSTHA
jgi:Ser/Thr protein kinase RdoA (MazF antagonist)